MKNIFSNHPKVLKSNDRIVFEVLSKTPYDEIHPRPDMRGKLRITNVIERDEINEHIKSFKSTNSTLQARTCTE